MTHIRPRRLITAGLVAAVAATGFGGAYISPAAAEPAGTHSTAQVQRGKLVINRGAEVTEVASVDGQLWAFRSDAYGTGARATVFTMPTPGNSGVVQDEFGQCLEAAHESTVRPGNGLMDLADCDPGSALQQWTVGEDGSMLVAGKSVGWYAGNRLGFWASNAPPSTIRDGFMHTITATVRGTDLGARSAQLSGVAAPGATLTFNGANAVVVAADGSWSQTLVGLALGNNAVEIEQFEDGVKTAAISTAIELSLTPVEADVVLRDDITLLPTVEGTGHPGATVEIWYEDELLNSVLTDAETGAFSAEIVAPNVGGAVGYTLKQTFGGEIAEQTATIIADYGVPVGILAPRAGAVHRGGALSFQGRGAIGAKVEVRVDGDASVLATTTVTRTGSWSTVIEARRGDATYVVTQTSAGNNVTRAQVDVKSDASQEQLVVTSPAQGAAIAPGNVVFVGTADAGAPIRLISAQTGIELGSATADADGNWRAEVNRELGAGSYTILVRRGSLSVQRGFVVRSAAATDFQVTSPVSGGTVSPGVVQFAGTANAGATITLRSLISGAILGATRADSLGNWTVAVNRTLGAGNYTIRVESGARSVDRTFVVNAPALQLDVATPAPGGSVAPGVVTFTGTANPNAEVQLRSLATGVQLGRGVADASGAWSVVVMKPLVRSTTPYTISVVNGGLRVNREFYVR